MLTKILTVVLSLTTLGFYHVLIKPLLADYVLFSCFLAFALGSFVGWALVELWAYKRRSNYRKMLRKADALDAEFQVVNTNTTQPENQNAQK